jgi:hypothetical protein
VPSVSAGMDRRAWIALGTTAAVAGCTYAVYRYLLKKREEEESQLVLTAIVEKVHVEFLEEAASKHTDGDTDKALVILIDYVMLGAKEEDVFESVRCVTCGAKDKTKISCTVSEAHERFLTSMAEKHALKNGKDKALRIIFDYAMADDAAKSIYGSS